jgi:hypothetical protein
MMIDSTSGARPRISDMIRDLISENDLLGREIFAGAINLHAKAMKGRLNRSWTEGDVSNLFIIVNILMTVYESRIDNQETSTTAGQGTEPESATRLPTSITELTGAPRRG